MEWELVLYVGIELWDCCVDDHAHVHACGHGLPWMNVNEGPPVLQAGQGELHGHGPGPRDLHPPPSLHLNQGCAGDSESPGNPGGLSGHSE